MSEERIFNHRRRWLLRRHISGSEIASGAAIVVVLAAVVGWVAAQRDNFNAAERDLAYEVLVQAPVEDTLYRTPLKLWVEPGAGPHGPMTAGAVNLGLFPSSVLADGWAISSRPRTFGPDTLFQKINGEAEKFIKLGFQQLHYLGLKSGSGAAEVSVELFDQGSFAGGLGIFSDHRTPDRTIQRSGDALYYATPVGAIGFSGRYFFRIAGNDGSSAVQEKTEGLIRTFASLEEGESAMPLPFRVLSQGMAIDPGRIGYQQSNVFQYDFARDFWFGRPEGEGPGRVFLHQANSPDAARKLFGQIAEEHGYDYTVVNRTEGSVRMRHDFLKTHFSMTAAGPILYGMENEADPARLEAMMDRMREVLPLGD